MWKKVVHGFEGECLGPDDHDHGQGSGPAAQPHLDAGLGVLLRRQEKGAVHQGVPVVDDHVALADHARDPVHLVGGVAGQDKDARLVVPNAALVFHLQSDDNFRMKADFFL